MSERARSLPVQGVLGPIAAADLGPTLVHEHLFVGWPGWNLDPLAEDARQTQYSDLIERLTVAREHGLRSVVDAAPADLGRSAPFLKQVSRDAGINVIASTGVYHESWGFPVYLKMRTTEDLTAIFLHDLSVGMDGTDALAGVIKLASAGAEISRHERKALTAAAMAATQSGAAVITHSSSAAVALDQARSLLAAGATPGQVQIGHCDSYALADLEAVLDTGVFVAFDQFVYDAKIDLAGRVAAIAQLVGRGFERQLTLSHDQIGVLGGRQVPLACSTRAFSYLWETVLPALRADGIGAAAIDTMLIENPRRLLCREA